MLVVAWRVPVVAGATTVISIGFGPGVICSAAQVTVSFDSVQRQSLLAETAENFTGGGNTVVITKPNPLSLFRSSAMTR